MKSKRHDTFYFSLEKPEEVVGVRAKNFAAALVRLEKDYDLRRVISLWTGEYSTILES